MDDLASLTLTSDEGATMTIRNPATGATVTHGPEDSPRPMTIHLLGADSEKYRKAEAAAANKRIAARGKKTVKVTIQELQEDTLNGLVGATVKWDVTFGGELLECTPKNVRGLYEKLPWLREQVEEFIFDRANFVKTSATT